MCVCVNNSSSCKLSLHLVFLKAALVSMANLWFLVLLLSPLSLLSASTTRKKTYIVHMNHHAKPKPYSTHHDWYTATVQSLTSSPDSFLYTYDTVFQGFAASLDQDQLNALKKCEHVLKVYEEKIYQLATTRTPQFLGLTGHFYSFHGKGESRIGKASQDIVVGLLDTGIWPESKSFHDKGMSKIPARWKGECVPAPDFDPKLCNKKLIGVRHFSKSYRAIAPKPWDIDSPRDYEGHGTHTASTAAGSPVANVSVLGFARGTARGVASQARLAIYKVCWTIIGCPGGDVLSALDAAAKDGVDVISMSFSLDQVSYLEEAFTLGTFAAMEKGIFVSASAGNSGPNEASLYNIAPWIVTVGAGTLDRNFPAQIFLGNKKQLTGASLYSGGEGMGKKPAGLVYLDTNNYTRLCYPGKYDPKLVRGKVVICDSGVVINVEKVMAVHELGGVGTIIVKSYSGDGNTLYLSPAVEVEKEVGDLIKKYAKNDPNPTALIRFDGTTVNVKPSPVVAAFSSRGPNKVTPQILKPDVIAPGVNILAAWPDTIPLTGVAEDHRRAPYNIISGTSMSTPHVTGIVALLKAAHPNWSASAVKSALMTTAYKMDNTNGPILDSATGKASNPWAYGSGHVDPRKALKPGLIYDISAEDYKTFLCSLNYKIHDVRAISGHPNMTCSRKFSDPGDLNYPSFSVLFGSKKVVRYSRELTNVGDAMSKYNVLVTAPPNVSIKVKPAQLLFKRTGEKKKYIVTFASRVDANSTTEHGFGYIVWKNAKYRVKSPVAFTWR